MPILIGIVGETNLLQYIIFRNICDFFGQAQALDWPKKIMERIIPISIWPQGLINCFLIKGHKKHILVDTGVPNSEGKILGQLKHHNLNPKDIGLIIVSHGHVDHFGSVAKLKEITGAPILAHPLDNGSYRTGKADISTMKLN